MECGVHTRGRRYTVALNKLREYYTGSSPVLTTTMYISVSFYIVLVLRYGVVSVCVVLCLKFYSNTTHKNTVRNFRL